MGMTKPAYTDTADIAILNTDLDILDIHDHSANAKGLAVKRINSAAFASRPAFSIAGQIYFSSDTTRLFLDTGAAWSEFANIANATTFASTLTSSGLLTASTGLTVSASGITVTGNSTITGTLGGLTGLTVVSGGLTVTAGNVGIGVAPFVSTGLYVASNATLTGTGQSGMYLQPTASSAATVSMDGVLSQPITAAAAFTCAAVAGLHAQSPIKGAGSTITSAYGLLVDSLTSGNTNNYGIYVGAPSGGSGDNQSLRVGGTSWMDSSLVITDSGNTTVAASGALRLHNVSGATGAIAWRNAANSADCLLGYDGQNALVLTGVFTSTTIGAAGGASAPPASPVTWMRVLLTGTYYKIPLYTNA